MKRLPLKRLQASEENSARIRFLFMEEGETEADFEEQRRRLIAEGKASETDRFIPFCWKASTSPDTSDAGEGA